MREAREVVKVRAAEAKLMAELPAGTDQDATGAAELLAGRLDRLSQLG